MINSNEFSQRLEKVMDYYGESASSFAEKIGVQRSSISHILSGRNKPSLDFIIKTISTYPEVEIYWLLNGKGSFPKSESNQLSFKENLDVIDQPKEIPTSSTKKHIERIVIFYSDGSFEDFERK